MRASNPLRPLLIILPTLLAGCPEVPETPARLDTSVDVAPDFTDDSDDVVDDVAPADAPGDVVADHASDAAPDASLDASPDASPDAAPDAVPDAAPDVSPDVALDAAADTAPDVTPDVAPDLPRDVAPDALLDASPDASPDVPPDVAPDVAPDAPRDVPPDAPLGGAASQLCGGGFHTCALVGGRVLCWGGNAYGELGDGTVGGTRPRAVVAAGLTDAVEIRCGVGFTCARRADGTVWCWGSNQEGQLANGVRGGSPVPTPRMIPGLTDVTALAVGSASMHVCALRRDRSVWCWGNNATGQCAVAPSAARPAVLAPTAVAGLADVAQIGAGAYHSCARTTAGAVLCWGNNNYGELGDGTRTNRAVPRAVTGVADAAEIALAHVHSCARSAGGALRCWGYNSNGQLGDGVSRHQDCLGTDCSPLPVGVVGIGDAAALAVGVAHTCARRAGGGVLCVGSNASGELGDGTTMTRFSPVSPAGLSGVVELSGGATTPCARTASALYCWGGNLYRQVGDDLPGNRLRPALVTALP